MNLKIIFTIGILTTWLPYAHAYKVVDDIATVSGGYEIPIKILLPENATGKRPVQFNVHGGGWNGGDKTQVPPASVPADATFLCDRLGIIYVGLAYRCKGNDGTFALAMQNLEASIGWFADRADQFGADMSRIGFTGGSAGTTLSALLAQRYRECKLYVGSEGMYNLVDHDTLRSYFPNATGRANYGLVTYEESFNASPFYNLREKPATALLLHGSDDFLCHPSQSQKFAEKIRQSGGQAEVILFNGINHTCRNPNYPEVLTTSVLAIARLFEKEFDLPTVDYNQLQKDLDLKLAGKYPHKRPSVQKIIGTWEGKKGSVVIMEKGNGMFISRNERSETPFTYHIEGNKIAVKQKEMPLYREFYLRTNGQFIYELILEESRLKSRREDYSKTGD
ncbi:MAG: alpha/beta hydrolase [Cyclobacteriaceae bacterium]